MSANPLNLTEELNNIDIYIAEQNKCIDAGKQLEALKASEGFQNVIINGYIEKESARLFEELMSIGDIDSEDILKRIDSIKHFKEYIGTSTRKGKVEMLAVAAPGNIEANRLVRVELSSNQHTLEE